MPIVPEGVRKSTLKFEAIHRAVRNLSKEYPTPLSQILADNYSIDVI